MILLNGKDVSKQIKIDLLKRTEKLEKQFGKTPKLVAVVVGNNPASAVYVRNKERAAKEVGIDFEKVSLSEDITQIKLNNAIKKLSNDETVTGIILQLPLPKHLNERVAISHINPIKDIDGLTLENLGKLMEGTNTLTACTAEGVMEMLKHYNIDIEGKHAVIVGRSLLVGKPLSQLLLKANATVTVCHTKTVNLPKYTKTADILISAAGQKGLITKKHVKKNAVVVDVAIVKDGDKLVGDVDFKSVRKVASHISPVPGGVGPMTVTMLLKNTLNAFELQNKKH